MTFNFDKELQELDEMIANYDYSKKDRKSRSIHPEDEDFELGGQGSYQRTLPKAKSFGHDGDNILKSPVGKKITRDGIFETFVEYSSDNDYYDAVEMTAKDFEVTTDLVEKVVGQERIERQTDSKLMEKLEEIAHLVFEDKDEERLRDFVSGMHKIKSGMSKSITLDESRVILENFVSLLDAPDGVHVFESMKDIFESLSAGEMVSAYQEYLNESMIDTSEYIKKNGHPPRGYKKWAFQIMEKTYWFQGSYAEARNKAIQLSKMNYLPENRMIILRG